MKFSVVVERDEDGYYIASVPALPGCHTQARTLDELTNKIREAIELYLETEGSKAEPKIELVVVWSPPAFSFTQTLDYDS